MLFQVNKNHILEERQKVVETLQNKQNYYFEQATLEYQDDFSIYSYKLKE